MNLPASSSSSASFDLLDERLKRWLWNEGWTELRDVQEKAIPALIHADQDVIIAAATAAGKTEAAFLPILSNLLTHETIGSVLYISPLKALINDQWERLDRLCELLDMPVVAWHGDVSSSKKHQFLKNPQGILLITPESLEALFVRRGTAVSGLMANLRYIVIDEIHSFMGTERGKQLQSLLHRIDLAVQRIVPRVGLSATLGDMKLATQFLRPHTLQAIRLIVADSAQQELKILLKGYVQSAEIPLADEDDIENVSAHASKQVAAHLYQVLLGSNNLVFPNTRQKVEEYTDTLRRLCEKDGLPNQFWAHHGSLSKEYREDTEQALKDKSSSATAICTSTLELGIDIGHVKSICQIGSPPSVASLRQRLGRSGRRKGEAAILRSYCIEKALKPDSALSDAIREELVQTIAMINLLLKGWFEPPRINGLHYSTLVQQILSLIAQKGGSTAGELWQALVSDGPFSGIQRQDFLCLLRYMGEQQLLMQDTTGLLLHGQKGENLVNHYEFFAAFAATEEFRLVAQGKALGSLPITHILIPGQFLIFAGRRWRVLDVDLDKKTILVTADKGGRPPVFESTGAWVHEQVRREMRTVLSTNEPVKFLDKTAAVLLAEARAYYQQAGLEYVDLVQNGKDTILMTWSGDSINDALVMLLNSRGIIAVNEGIAVRLVGVLQAQAEQTLKQISDNQNEIDAVIILKNAKNIIQQKWDWALPDDILRKSYASLNLDFQGACHVIDRIITVKISTEKIQTES